MRRCYERYFARSPLANADEVTVLDLGGADVNGNYREVFSEPRFKYVVADISDDASVDLHLTDPHRVPLPDASVDVVISGQMLEHCEFFWLVFAEMVRLLKPSGFLFLIAPSAGPVHRYPVDCYRFHPDAYAALAKHAGCVLVEVWRDERGPWHDLVGVFRRKDAPALPPSAPGAKVAEKPQVVPEYRDRDAQEERVSAGPTYLEVLKSIHAGLAPRLYLEIGVRKGKSLALASCPAIAVDPQPALPT